MTIIENEARPKDFVPGTISRKTYDEVSSASSHFFWNSLTDGNLVQTFFPRLEIVKREVRTNFKLYDGVLSKSTDLPRIITGYEPKRQFAGKTAREIQLALLQLEVNRSKLLNGQKIEKRRLRWIADWKEKRLLVLNVGFPYQIAPVWDEDSRLVLSKEAGYKDELTPQRIDPDHLPVIYENREVLRLLGLVLGPGSL